MLILGSFISKTSMPDYSSPLILSIFLMIVELEIVWITAKPYILQKILFHSVMLIKIPSNVKWTFSEDQKSMKEWICWKKEFLIKVLQWSQKPLSGSDQIWVMTPEEQNIYRWPQTTLRRSNSMFRLTHSTTSRILEQDQRSWFSNTLR